MQPRPLGKRWQLAAGSGLRGDKDSQFEKSNEFEVKLHSSSLVLHSLKTQGSKEASLGCSVVGQTLVRGWVSAVGGPHHWGGRRLQAELTPQHIPVVRGQGGQVIVW